MIDIKGVLLFIILASYVSAQGYRHGYRNEGEGRGRGYGYGHGWGDEGRGQQYRAGWKSNDARGRGRWGHGKHHGHHHHGGTDTSTAQGDGTYIERWEMMDLIHTLINHHDLIERDYNVTANGIESYTRSNDSQVASWIKTHAYHMEVLMEREHGMIRGWDDLFYELFAAREDHPMNVTNKTDGVHVEMNVASHVNIDDIPCIKSLIEAHAETVSRFVEHGRREMRLNHPVPNDCD